MALNKPLGYYCDELALRFHLLEVGEGLMVLLVFPNNQVMLFDCNVRTEDEDTLIEYLSDNIPLNYDPDTETQKQIIHVFVNSHRDEDHYRGLKKVNENFPIKSIWDSGQSGATTNSSDYLYYMGLRRRLRDKNPNNLKVLTPTNIPVATVGGAEIYCFSGKEDYAPGFDNGITIFKEAAKIQHTNSVVLQIRYGGTALLLTGDSDWKCWKEKIIPNFSNSVKSEILIASHHGSRSFFTDEENDTIDVKKNPDTTYLESIDKIDPDVVLISCGNYDQYHHPNKEAKKIYLESSENNQVYSTHTYGHLLGYIDNSGHYTVVPRRFRETRTAAPALTAKIECTYAYNDKTLNVANGATLPTGGVLNFKLKTSGGIIEPMSKVKIYWEVSNGGIEGDSSHQEIYYKGENEPEDVFSFSRTLSFNGIHLLRCRIYNKEKGSITKVFKVIGI